MKKAIFFLCYCLFVFLICARADQITIDKQTSQPAKEIIQNNDPSIFINERINSLEKKLEDSQKQYDRLLESQQHNYNINVTVLIALLTFACLLIGISFLYNFYIAEQRIKKELDKSKNYFQDRIKEISGRILGGSKKDYNELLEFTKKGLKEAEADYQETCGRAHHVDLPSIGALWFLRSMKTHMEIGSPDKDIKKEIDLAIIALGKEKDKLDIKDFITEMENNVSLIDEKKFPQKLQLQQLIEKIKPEAKI